MEKETKTLQHKLDFVRKQLPVPVKDPTRNISPSGGIPVGATAGGKKSQ